MAPSSSVVLSFSRISCVPLTLEEEKGESFEI
jgi:hypothetical protein